MKITLIPLWIAILFVQACDAFSSPPSPVETRRVSRRGTFTTTMLVDNNDDKGKQKIISPNDISSLFGGGTKSTKNEKVSDYEDEDEDFDYGDTVVSPPATEDASSVEKSEMIQETDVKTEESETMRELFALEEMTKRPPVVQEEVEEEEVSVASTEALVVAAADAVMESDVDEYGMGYMNLNRKLDKATRKSVLDTISMAESKSDSQLAQLTLPRLVTYDPTETFRGDPMKVMFDDYLSYTSHLPCSFVLVVDLVTLTASSSSSSSSSPLLLSLSWLIIDEALTPPPPPPLLLLLSTMHTHTNTHI